jgi:peptidoglycan hydrolase-like protein with peptidoglycan-binding domain
MWKGHGFRWGGDFTTSVPDPMHFEFMGSVAEARATYARLRRFLGAVPPSPAPSPQPTAPGERGRIMELQRLLRVTADGVVGPATEGAMRRNMIGWRRDLPGNRNPNLVMWLQRQGRRKGYALKVDGQVGPEVNHLIVVVLGQRDGICGPNGYRAACR